MKKIITIKPYFIQFMKRLLLVLFGVSADIIIDCSNVFCEKKLMHL